MSILFQFEVETIALFVAMTFFVQATVIGAQAYLIRELKQYRGVIAALLANLCAAVGLMIRLFAEQLPIFLTIIVSNMLILTGTAMFYIALSQFTGFAYKKIALTGIFVSVLAFLLYFTYGVDEVGKRILVISLGSIAMVSLLIHQLWQIQKTALKLSANLMLVSFLVYGLFLVIRTIAILLQPPLEVSGLSPVQSATYLFAFALSFFWSMGFILMVSQRLRNDLMEVATIDVLTRIPNRRATQTFLERELSRSQRDHSEFSILLIDLDNFKQVNDRWGHAMGDYVLVKTAGIFQSMIRKHDWAGRWGGEEFLIILPSTPDAQALAERLRREIANSEYKQGDITFNITISIGVARGTSANQIDELLTNADQALYTAKLTKNTVSMANVEK
ncbi:MAG TPA: GGDEF domain-containing protein [Anaerolineales bacterium]|nr:GGDEF domain-containing protein [Anaerolineales bacterium]